MAPWWESNLTARRSRDRRRSCEAGRAKPAGRGLEQAPKKSADFFDANLLGQFDLARSPVDRIVPRDRKAR